MDKNEFKAFIEVFRTANEPITVNYGEKEIILPETTEDDRRVRMYFDKETGEYKGKTIE